MAETIVNNVPKRINEVQLKDPAALDRISVLWRGLSQTWRQSDSIITKRTCADIDSESRFGSDNRSM